MEENPSLRGIEKVVAEEGLKAVLTLRLSPILPIPLGMYNYVYGVSNVKFTDFAGGIFLGSLKPYFLDSYLGYFGKSLIDGTANDGGMQDYILIGVLGVSVLIGVFASQLAAETWDAIQQEEAAQKKIEGGDESEKDKDDGITKEVFGVELPQWLVGFQYALQDADKRMNELVLKEFDAKVWNCTEGSTMFGYDPSKNDLPDNKNPALIDPTSPELTEKYEGVDFGATSCDGLVLSPVLFSYYFKFADPLFDEAEFLKERDEEDAIKPMASEASATTVTIAAAAAVAAATTASGESAEVSPKVAQFKEGILLNELEELKDEAKQRLEAANKKLDELNSKS